MCACPTSNYLNGVINVVRDGMLSWPFTPQHALHFHEEISKRALGSKTKNLVGIFERACGGRLQGCTGKINGRMPGSLHALILRAAAGRRVVGVAGHVVCAAGKYKWMTTAMDVSPTTTQLSVTIVRLDRHGRVVAEVMDASQLSVVEVVWPPGKSSAENFGHLFRIAASHRRVTRQRTGAAEDVPLRMDVSMGGADTMQPSTRSVGGAEGKSPDIMLSHVPRPAPVDCNNYMSVLMHPGMFGHPKGFSSDRSGMPTSHHTHMADPSFGYAHMLYPMPLSQNKHGAPAASFATPTPPHPVFRSSQIAGHMQDHQPPHRTPTFSAGRHQSRTSEPPLAIAIDGDGNTNYPHAHATIAPISSATDEVGRAGGSANTAPWEALLQIASNARTETP